MQAFNASERNSAFCLKKRPVRGTAYFPDFPKEARSIES
jgi:hypothetical protein